VLEKRRGPANAEIAVEDPTVHEEPAMSFDSPVEEEELEAAIESLPQGARDALVLCGVYGYEHSEAASMLGCSGSAMFRQVVLPAALPSIFNGLRVAHGFAWILIVVGEMTGVPTGLGSVIMDGRTLSRTELVICGMIVIGVAGYLSDRVVVAVGNRLLRWSPTHNA